MSWRPTRYDGLLPNDGEKISSWTMFPLSFFSYSVKEES